MYPVHRRFSIFYFLAGKIRELKLILELPENRLRLVRFFVSLKLGVFG
jgi:hypothetical protein